MTYDWPLRILSSYLPPLRQHKRICEMYKIGWFVLLEHSHSRLYSQQSCLQWRFVDCNCDGRRPSMLYTHRACMHTQLTPVGLCWKHLVTTVDVAKCSQQHPIIVISSVTTYNFLFDFNRKNTSCLYCFWIVLHCFHNWHWHQFSKSSKVVSCSRFTVLQCSQLNIWNRFVLYHWILWVSGNSFRNQWPILETDNLQIQICKLLHYISKKDLLTFLAVNRANI